MTIRDTIEGNWRREVDFLKALVRAPSDNPPGDCAPAAEVAAQELAALGFTVERHRVPAAVVEAAGMKSATNLIIRQMFGSGGPTVALNAHGDVVPPGNGWSVDPYGAVEESGALYGRGVAVSKSDFATYAFALLALLANPQGLNGTVELHFTYDEEAGGTIGPKWLLDQKLTRPTMAISAGFSYAITTAHNGVLHLEVTVRGKQAHAAMPFTGADALEAAVPVLAAIYGERRRLAGIVSKEKGIGSPQITVGLISGGINTNVVPDRITFRLDRRIVPDEDGAAVEKALVTLIEKALPKMPGITVECRRIMLAEPLRPLPGVDRMVTAIQRHAQEVLGVAVEPTGVPLYTDARHYAAAGVPTVLYGAGPRSILEANAHGADEHLQLSDLRAATEVIAFTLADLLKPV
ncbi:MAG TPA: M20/M25/M40 family metallo-hydrolase [Bauldia sp.]|nr:M20/M25/M40 family metallo-hydrolase [Bauldia sp.]